MSKKILIVEDDPSLLEIYSLAFELEGFEIIKAENGKMALDLLVDQDRALVPDCIVTDLQMAMMTGNTLINIIRTSYDKRFADVPIIVCSAHGEMIKRDWIFEHIQKPVSLDQLIEGVNRALHRGSGERQVLQSYG